MKPSDFQRQFSTGGGYTPDEPTGPRIEKVRRILSASAAKKILDIGCSNGAILKPLASSRDLHGVDISDELVQRANAMGMKGTTRFSRRYCATTGAGMP